MGRSVQNDSLQPKTVQEEYDEYMSRLKEAEEKGEVIVEIKVPGLKQLKEQYGEKVGERMYEIYKAREKENNKNMRIIFEDEGEG